MNNEEEVLEPKKHVLDSLGMIDYDHFKRFKEDAVHGLTRWGNKFQFLLGLLLNESSDKDAVKLIRCFRNECTQHELLHKIYVAKKKAEEEEKSERK